MSAGSPESDFRCADPADMLGRIRGFPDQIRDARRQVAGLSLPEGFAHGLTGVVITGMGGSAIGGDLVAGLAGAECPVPMVVHRSYGIPAWVSDTTLVIASSYSGGTEETLSAWDAAGEAGARRIAVTTGGPLKERALSAGSPLLEFSYEAPPRAALGYSFTLILGLLGRLGLIADPDGALDDGLALLEEAGAEWEPGTPEERNPAKRLARQLENGLPVMLGAGHLTAVARRWTTQVNENAKSWAVFAEYPELNHNIVVGLERPAAAGTDSGGGITELARVCQLHSAHYHERVARRMAITGELLDRAGIERVDVRPPEGADPLGELLWTTWLGDYVSYYLAGLYGVDPSPVEPIDYLKGKLSGE